MPAATLRRACVTASVVWAAAIPVATALSSIVNPTMPVYVFSAVVFAIGSAVCHQLPERSLHVWGRQLPVCARCCGIYIAAAIVSLILVLARHRSGEGRPSMRARGLRLWMGAVAVTLNLLTLVYEWTTGVMPANGVRLAAGALLGGAVAAFIVYDVD
jgi:uncharacterized membrane protein